MQRLRGCGPPDGGYSVVKVQLKEAFTYSEVRRGKSQPWLRNFLKVPSLIPTFRPLFVNPVSEKTSETTLGDAFGHQLRGGGIKFCRGKVLSHIRTFEGVKVNPPTVKFFKVTLVTITF